MSGTYAGDALHAKIHAKIEKDIAKTIKALKKAVSLADKIPLNQKRDALRKEFRAHALNRF